MSNNTTRFRVRRTSEWDDDVPPCEGAVRATVTRVDALTFKSPEEHDSKPFAKPEGRRWFDNGRDHGYMPDGGIYRLFDEEAWTLDLTADELLGFAEQHGQIVLDTGCLTLGATPELEIYDSYRE